MQAWSQAGAAASWTRPRRYPIAARAARSRRLLRLRGAIFCALLAAVAVRTADAGPWSSHGPVGGHGTAIAIDPSSPATMYAGTSGGGFFKTSDGGASWTAINHGVPAIGDWRVEAIAVDPATPVRVYAAVGAGLEGGVLRSNDAGASWTFQSLGLLTDLAIDPVTPSTVWATGESIYKSTDAGASWTPVLSTGGFRSIAIDRAAPATVYVGTLFGSVVKTTDGGAHWTTLASGLASDQVEAVAVDPTTPATVYAGLQDFGVYKSIDAGLHWAAVGPTVGGAAVSVEALAIDPTTPATLYAGGFVPGPTGSLGVYKSIDGGATWDGTPITALVRALALDASSPTRLIAATEDGVGVWQTTDAAASWSESNDGIVNTNVVALATAPSAQGVTYAATLGNGVFRSDDGGAVWQPTSFTDDLSVFAALAVDPATAQTAYLGTQSAGVLKTIDGGASWAPVNSGDLPPFVLALAVDPVSPTIVYAAGFGGVGRSTTGGGDWTLVNDGLFPVVSALAIDPSAPATLYAGTDPLMGPFTGVFKSTDSGAHWAAVNTGLPGGDGNGVQALAVDPAAPATVYAALESGGVYKTSDGGVGWQAVNNGLVAGAESAPDVRALVVDPVVPDTVYAGTAGAGVFVTSNGGASWTATNLGLDNLFVRALAIEPGRLYAGTAADGTFVRDVPMAAAQAILGRSFTVRNPRSDDPSRRKIVLVASAPQSAATLDVDALLAGGAVLTITVQGQQLQSQTFDLPASAWSRAGTGAAQYVDRKGVHGPVASVVLARSKAGTVKLSATLLGKIGSGAQPRIALVPPDPGTAGGARLEVNGGASYCVGFGGDAGGDVRNDGARLLRVTKPSVARCP